MDTQKSASIETITRAILEKMGMPATVILHAPLYDGQGEFVCDIRVEEDSNLLIGQHGINLQALQYIIRLIARKQLGEDVSFALDVNAYWEQKGQALIREAREAAEKALRDRIPMVLRPMTAYERKVIHLEIAKNEQVVTESIGVGEARKVVIKPATIV